jgi:glucose uptake protein
MIIPGSHTAVLILLVLGLLGWGMWANTFKLTGGKWRFELFCFDFALGMLLASIVIAFTAGSLGFDGFAFTDDLVLAGKRQDLYGFVAGMTFNLGNMLLLGAISVTGLAVAFPAAMGFALIMSILWRFALNQNGNPLVLLGGAALLAVAIVFDILNDQRRGTGIGLIQDKLTIPAADRVKADAVPVKGKTKKHKIGYKGILLSLFAGMVLGSYPPLVQLGRSGENGLGPYSFGFVFAVGVLASTFVYNLFFMNLPVHGAPIDMGQYFRGRLGRHGLGLLGGILWYTGMIANLVAGKVDATARVSGPVNYVLAQGGLVIAALCGLFLWKEYGGADSSVKIRLGLMMFLLVAGIALLAVS